ncbi:MAG TPA: HNH endonuclease [Gammaproteobacteria bacterium]|nr:HNH endonuclease [Gammaproteobacteria bacterium]
MDTARVNNDVAITEGTSKSNQNSSPPMSKPKIKTFIDPESVSKINDPARKPKITSDGKVIPRGDAEGEAKTIINKKNIDKDGYVTARGKKLKYDENGFPVFNSKFDTVLNDQHLGTGNDYQHFKAANESLAKQLNNNPGLAREMKLTQAQIDFLKKIPPDGEAPPGLTWHHHQDVGRMQLIDKAIHGSFKHTGGMSIWGGGY